MGGNNAFSYSLLPFTPVDTKFEATFAAKYFGHYIKIEEKY